jgi:hypothetical protein
MIAGVPHSELEQLHWNHGGGRGALGLRHLPYGIAVVRECPPGVPVLRVIRELEAELKERLRHGGVA